MELNSTPHLQDTLAESAKVTLFRNVYIWMTLALIITAITAFYIAASPSLYIPIITNSFLFFGLLIAELGVVWFLSARIGQLSFTTATVMFVAYSVLNGITMSIIFLAYTNASIALTFFITAGTFGTMAAIGTLTKRDLSSWGSILFMALIGLIIASVANMFLQNEIFYWIISYVGVIIFVALTAYDAQKIKRMIEAHGNEINETTQKIALMGALSLYLDFINLFLFLLRIFGGRK